VPIQVNPSHSLQPLEVYLHHQQMPLRNSFHQLNVHHFHSPNNPLISLDDFLISSKIIIQSVRYFLSQLFIQIYSAYYLIISLIKQNPHLLISMIHLHDLD